MKWQCTSLDTLFHGFKKLVAIYWASIDIGLHYIFDKKAGYMS